MDASIKQLLDILKTDRVMTSAQIASVINLSERTVRTRLKMLSNELEQHGAVLIARPGSGFQIKVNDRKLFFDWSNETLKTENVIPSTSSERVHYILGFLLDNNEYVKLDDIAQVLFVSRNTVTADLKRVEYILNLYQLKICRKPNYGIRIEGSELNRRICIANCLYKNNASRVEASQQREDVRKLSKIVNKAARKYRLKMTENVFENLIGDAFIANNRIRQGHLMKYTQDKKDEMLQIIGDKAIYAANEMSEEIEKQIGVRYNEDEVLYFALHLSGKVSSDSQGKYGNNLVISSRIDELVLKMLNAIYDGLHLDFRNNLELRMSLNQHMVPLDIRLRYDILMENPLLEQIKTNYAPAYTVAATAASALKKHYNKEIPEDEIGYFAVLFALVMERKDKTIRKYNIVVVCASGRGTSQLFMHKYKQAFSQYINKIYELTVFDLEVLDLTGLGIDFVFTTIPLNIHLPVPVYEVSLFLDSNEITNYQKIFEKGDQSFIYRYFSHDLFIPDLKAANKESAIFKICEFAKWKKNLPDDFYELVIKREEMGQTDFGNLVAIPHPYKVVEGDKFVVAAILEKPVWWGHNDVQVVFLISLSQEDDQDIEQFYSMITHYLSDLDLVLETVNNPSFSNLIVQLEAASQK